MKACILYDRECIECGECRCELDPNRICDNCFRCLEAGEDRPYAEIPIGRVFLSEDEYLSEAQPVHAQHRIGVRIKTLPGCSGARFF